MVFSIPSFVGVGDEYDKVGLTDQRAKGRNFAVPGPKEGNLPSALFQKEFLSIHEGDKYIDPGTADKRYHLEQAKKRISDQIFRMSNPPSKNPGLGGFYGCIGDHYWPHETDYVVPRKGEAPPRKEPAKRGIFTNSSKKGTYGVVGTTISKIGQDYVASFYDAVHQRAKADLEKHYKLMKGAPFKAACRRGGAFDEALGTGTSQCYRMTKPMAKVKPPKVVETKASGAAWKPAGKAELKPIIEYREDPYDHFDPRVGVQKKKPSERTAFKPSGSSNTSWYTKSIAFARL